jgi:hypothetical protein
VPGLRFWSWTAASYSACSSSVIGSGWLAAYASRHR